jgi:hypothetical protein
VTVTSLPGNFYAVGRLPNNGGMLWKVRWAPDVRLRPICGGSSHQPDADGCRYFATSLTWFCIHSLYRNYGSQR